MRPINIYKMYLNNNCKYGFYVQRDSWATVFAKILEIENVIEGNTIAGLAPYYNMPNGKNPKVYGEIFKNGIYKGVKEIPCPGSYGYSKYDPFKEEV